VKPNPLALLAPALILGVLNALTLDVQTHLLSIGAAVICVPLLHVPARRFIRTAWPLVVAAATLLLVNALADPAPGLGWADFGTGVTTALRLLAIALPGLVAFMAIEPVSLVDALVRFLRVPPRFGYGALAAMRLIPSLTDDLRTRRLALRARGATPHGVSARITGSVQVLLGLLVTAIRRATRLATALDARGFDTLRRATARPSIWTIRDTTWCLSGLIASALIMAITVTSGSWHSLGTG